MRVELIALQQKPSHSEAQKLPNGKAIAWRAGGDRYSVKTTQREQSRKQIPSSIDFKD